MARPDRPPRRCIPFSLCAWAAYITICDDLTGEFQFELVQGEIDGRVETVDGVPRFDFSWLGFDENDPVSGRGGCGSMAIGRKDAPPATIPV